MEIIVQRDYTEYSNSRSNTVIILGQLNGLKVKFVHTHNSPHITKAAILFGDEQFSYV